MFRKKISIAIPASVVSDTPHLREKTSKIGVIGRAAAIFRVDEIVIYPDKPETNQTNETELPTLLLSYMETPQYLRKSLFRLRPELQYAGILPPLRTAHHPLQRRTEELRVGEYREGVTLPSNNREAHIDIGVEQPALLCNQKLPANKRITVKVTHVDKNVEVELASRDEIHEYWGYKVIAEKRKFGAFVRGSKFDLTIATSKSGTAFNDVKDKIADEWERAGTILVAFGSPSQGLPHIVSREDLRLEDIVDFVINTIPEQGTETVRTEEALIASMAVFSNLLSKA
ncbi:MAG TPA: RNA methyltransferase [Candidatus Eisenbacteria bacterium]|nr:RNA methyltransferase [Candidatus Eisenbacteria bacterium]